MPVPQRLVLTHVSHWTLSSPAQDQPVFEGVCRWGPGGHLPCALPASGGGGVPRPGTPGCSLLPAVLVQFHVTHLLCSELWRAQMATALPDPEELGAEPSQHGGVRGVMNALGTHRPPCLMSAECSECSSKAML